MQGCSSGGRWLADSAEITLAAAAQLAGMPTVSRDPNHIRTLRDLCEQASMWLELLEREATERTDDDTLHAAAWVGRVSAGLAARMRAPPADAPPEIRRLAIACLSDLDRHRAWSDSVLRTAEQRGEASSMHGVRVGLPSVREFAVPRGRARGA